MTDRTPSTPSDRPPSPSSPAGQDCLTEPQRRLAQLLGRLLAERWQEEQQEKQAAGSREGTNGEIDDHQTP